MGAQPLKLPPSPPSSRLTGCRIFKKLFCTTSTITTTFSLILTLFILVLSSKTSLAQQQELQVDAKQPAVKVTTDLRSLLENSEIQFTQWDKNVTYASSTRYYARGMQPLYNATHEVLKWFIGKEAIPEGYIVVSDRNIKAGPKVDNNEWGDLVKHYWAILLVVVICALLVVLMPIIGLCFCCCRCAGACGGRSQPFDKKHDTCRRVFLGLLLICAATGLLFGVVVTFATNSYMQEGIDESTQSVRDASADTQLFLDTSSQHLEHLLVTNFQQLSDQLRTILNEAANFVFTDLKNKSQAVSFQHLNEFVHKLPSIERDLSQMKLFTNELRVNASQLSDGLRGVKRELLQLLSKCHTKECKNVIETYEIGKLDSSEIDYNQIPDVSNIIESVNKLLDTDIANVVKNGNDALVKMETTINKTISETTPEISKSINKAGDAIKKTSNDITKMLKSVVNQLGNNTNSAMDTADKYLNEYGIYRFYVGVAISSILLLVLCAITFALFCGICGKRPDGYGDDCCNKGSGSRFLMLAVAVIFLTISILAVAALIHFLVGLILYRGVCVPLKNPENDQIFQYIDNYIDLNKLFTSQQRSNKYRNFHVGSLPPYRISQAIASCQENKAIYDVLNLQHACDACDISIIKEYPKQYNINETLEELVKKIDVDTQIIMLTPSDIEKIQDLRNSDLKYFDPDKFIDNLNDTITKFSLRDIAKKLRETADKINKPDMTEIAVSLRNQALHLETYQDNLVAPMTSKSMEMKNLAQSLDKSLRIRGLPFEDSITKMIEEIEKAQESIKVNGTKMVREAAQLLAAHFSLEMENYLTYVVNDVQKDVGKCGPLANVYESGIVAGCNKFVDPLNGFWSGVGWCVLLFLPTLIISIKLSTLYQKSDPYPGPLVESEYLYDAYNEHDNIPLSNGPKNKRRKNKERRRGSRDRRGDYYEESGGSSRVPSAGDSNRDTRYNDMAPKHWDGGPPRYANPPMAPPASEYERPPPYYYPGANDQE